MSATKKGAASRHSIDPQELREQEVLRANRELAAYFKGRRTEREARAALKIVKAFIRDREHTDPVKRRPLPGAAPPGRQKNAAARKTAVATKGRRRMVPKRRPRLTAPTASAIDASVSSSAYEDRVGEHSGIVASLTHD
jgi:hypothetical protein